MNNYELNFMEYSVKAKEIGLTEQHQFDTILFIKCCSVNHSYPSKSDEGNFMRVRVPPLVPKNLRQNV